MLTSAGRLKFKQSRDDLDALATRYKEAKQSPEGVAAVEGLVRVADEINTKLLERKLTDIGEIKKILIDLDGKFSKKLAVLDNMPRSPIAYECYFLLNKMLQEFSFKEHVPNFVVLILKGYIKIHKEMPRSPEALRAYGRVNLANVAFDFMHKMPINEWEITFLQKVIELQDEVFPGGKFVMSDYAKFEAAYTARVNAFISDLQLMPYQFVASRQELVRISEQNYRTNNTLWLHTGRTNLLLKMANLEVRINKNLIEAGHPPLLVMTAHLQQHCQHIGNTQLLAPVIEQLKLQLKYLIKVAPPPSKYNPFKKFKKILESPKKAIVRNLQASLEPWLNTKRDLNSEEIFGAFAMQYQTYATHMELLERTKKGPGRFSKHIDLSFLSCLDAITSGHADVESRSAIHAILIQAKESLLQYYAVHPTSDCRPILHLAELTKQLFKIVWRHMEARPAAIVVGYCDESLLEFKANTTMSCIA